MENTAVSAKVQSIKGHTRVICYGDHPYIGYTWFCKRKHKFGLELFVKIKERKRVKNSVDGNKK